MTLSRETPNKYFNYATSARESCIEFCKSEITTKEFLRYIYYRPAKKFFKGWLNKFGVNESKKKIYRVLRKFTDNGWPAFDTEDRIAYV